MQILRHTHKPPPTRLILPRGLVAGGGIHCNALFNLIPAAAHRHPGNAELVRVTEHTRHTRHASPMNSQTRVVSGRRPVRKLFRDGEQYAYWTYARSKTRPSDLKVADGANVVRRSASTSTVPRKRWANTDQLPAPRSECAVCGPRLGPRLVAHLTSRMPRRAELSVKVKPNFEYASLSRLGVCASEKL